MKRIITIFAVIISSIFGAAATSNFPAVPQDGKNNGLALNDNPDSIIGEYLITDQGNDTKVRFTKNEDGTYDCRTFWMADPIDPSTGKPWVDSRNPDKSLRNRRTDSMVIISGLKYDAAKKVWNGAKVYDPNRGIKANVTCQFLSNGDFQLKGTVLGIGEKVVWKKLK